MGAIELFKKSVVTSSSKSVSFSLLVLRIGISISMIFLHGYPRFINFSKINSEFADPLGIGTETSLVLVVFAEFFCSLFLLSNCQTVENKSQKVIKKEQDAI
mgnify:CR=1 FL=1